MPKLLSRSSYIVNMEINPARARTNAAINWNTSGCEYFSTLSAFAITR